MMEFFLFVAVVVAAAAVMLLIPYLRNTTSSARVIVLPIEEERRAELREKLAEYRERMRRNLYRAPELQMDTICKIAVLSHALSDGKVDTGKLATEMSREYGSGFSFQSFENAVVVIDDYCKTGGKNLKNLQ